MVVVFVGTGDLPLDAAVPVVMGANIGTSVTCVLVSLGHVTRDAPFRRAFAGATVHDLFNLLTVVMLLPLELATGLLRHSADILVKMFFRHPQTGGSVQTFKSPVKTAERLADLAVHNRVWVAVYVLGVFFCIPALGIFLWR